MRVRIIVAVVSLCALFCVTACNDPSIMGTWAVTYSAEYTDVYTIKSMHSDFYYLNKISVVKELYSNWQGSRTLVESVAMDSALMDDGSIRVICDSQLIYDKASDTLIIKKDNRLVFHAKRLQQR